MAPSVPNPREEAPEFGPEVRSEKHKVGGSDVTAVSGGCSRPVARVLGSLIAEPLSPRKSIAENSARTADVARRVTGRGMNNEAYRA
jgi:hypothetical protein